MPRAKKKPQPTAPQPAATQATTSDVLTLAEAATYLRVSEQDVMTWVHSQGLPGRCVAGEWRFLKTAIQQWLSSGKSPLQANKEAWASIIGAWKDDPYLEDMVEEIYRRRGRPITEDGSYRLFHGLKPEDFPK